MTNFDGRAYQARFDALSDEGVDVHGEAALVRSFGPSSVLDAGCGTGRVAIELARHGVGVVGVDMDGSMIAEARRRAPGIEWIQADLTTLDLGWTFDVVVLAGNVPLFCPAATRPALVARCAAHVGAGGVLIAGFQLDRGYQLEEFDRASTDSGLVLGARWATWDEESFSPDGDYAVSVFHRRSR
jgi:SAM-dependent methyltransferase